MSAAAGFSPLGEDLFGEEIKPDNVGPLRQEFVAPPCSILDSRDGAWQERKRAWKSIGIQSEVGRGEDLIGGFTSAAKLQRKVQGGNMDLENALDTGTSIFDPVLCEILFRWFSAPGSVVVDPCAGGSVRGIVAALLGRHYYGIELRPEQVSSNVEQAAEILPRYGAKGSARWYNSDGRETEMIWRQRQNPLADFLMTCPPYFDLEVYSKLPGDLSAMTYDEFKVEYSALLYNAAQVLAPDRFAAVVISSVRDEKGFYRDLPSLTTAAMATAGLGLYNEAILVNVMGTIPVRTRMTFGTNRKLPRAHQEVLIYCKGDPAKAAAHAKQEEVK